MDVEGDEALDPSEEAAPLSKIRAPLEEAILPPDGWISIPNNINPSRARVKLPDDDRMPIEMRNRMVWAFSDWLPKVVEDPAFTWILQRTHPNSPSILMDNQTASRLEGLEHQFVWNKKKGLLAIHILRDSSMTHYSHVNLLPCSYLACKKVSPDSLLCGRCRIAHYCDTTCQKLDYLRHRPVCLELADQKQCIADPVDTGIFTSVKPSLPLA